MLVKETIPFVDNTVDLAQSADPHLEQQGILIMMPNRQQLSILNIYILPRSSCNAGHYATIAHLLSNIEMSLIVEDIYAHHSRWNTNTNEDERGEHINDEIHATDNLFFNENVATRLPTNGRSTSPDINLASNDIALLCDWPVFNSLASDNLPILIIINSEQSTVCLGEPTSSTRKRTGHVMLKPATNTLLNLAKKELSSKPRGPSGMQ